MELTHQIIFVAGVLFLVSILATAITPRLGVPLLLVFLVVGMLAGEDGPGGIHFADYRLANLAATAALAVVLFDGGLRTRIASFRVGLRPALSLAGLGTLITAAITGILATALLDLHWAEGALVGAIVASTDAAAVFSLLHTKAVSLNERVTSALEIESGTNDPMAVFLTLAVIQYLQAPDHFGWSDALGMLLWQMAGGAAIGLGGGWLLQRALDRLRLADSLYPLLALFGGLLTFGVAGVVHASGFLAVYLAGLYLGNGAVRGLAGIRRFHDGIAWMSQIGMFVILGLLVSPHQLLELLVPGLLLSAALILVARPVAVWLSLLPFRFPWREQAYISWVGLRGSVPILLATYPWLAGLEQAQLYFNIAFFTVLVSLVVQGSTVASAARLLGLQLPRTSARVHRVDIDLPGQRGYEVVSYRIASNSSLVGLRHKQLPLPEPSRVISLARGGQVLAYRDWGPLRAGDYLSLLAAQSDLPALDQIFEAARPAETPAARLYFGEFAVRPDAGVADLCAAYGIPVPTGAEGVSLGEILARHLPHPVVGDRIRLGDLQLVVKRVDGDRAVEIGLRLPH
ncbi:MAG TPA: potassium/proton antiporter [Solimonas sp.]|nr:potassium/proton antiporter [Solimonas sp.]